jgi:hypothetical protein
LVSAGHHTLAFFISPHWIERSPRLVDPCFLYSEWFG